MKIDILGVGINNDPLKNVVSGIAGYLTDGKQHFIVTPNPEFLVVAQKDKEFKKILNEADIAVPDGIGLSFASFLLYGKILLRITGNDLITKCIETIVQKNLAIFLLGGLEKGTAIIAGQKLKEKYPSLRVAGTFGEKIIVDPKIPDQEIIDSINKSSADVLIVALGQVKQEKFIYYNLSKMHNIKLAIGVGGVLEFLTGKQKRAPKFMRKIGLEWLYRLAREPKRLRRILNAVIVFPLMVIIRKFH